MIERPITSIGTNDGSIDFGAGVVGPSNTDIARSNLHSRDSFTSKVKRQIAYVGGAFSLALAACSGGAGEAKATLSAGSASSASCSSEQFVKDKGYQEIPAVGENVPDRIFRISQNDRACNERSVEDIFAVAGFAEALELQKQVQPCPPNAIKEPRTSVDGQPVLVTDWWSNKQQGAPIRTDPLNIGSSIPDRTIRADTKLVQECAVNGPDSQGRIGQIRRFGGFQDDYLPVSTWLPTEEIRREPLQPVVRATPTPPRATPTAPRPAEATATAEVKTAWLKAHDVWSGELGTGGSFILAAEPSTVRTDVVQIVVLGYAPQSRSPYIEGWTQVTLRQGSIGSQSERVNGNLGSDGTLTGTFKDPNTQEELRFNMKYVGNAKDLLVNTYLSIPNRLPQKTAEVARERIQLFCNCTLP